MIDEIHIIDDVIPKSYQDEIEKVLLYDAQWMLKYDVTYDKSLFDQVQATNPSLKPRPGFNHSLVRDFTVVSPIHVFLKPLILQGLDRVGLTLDRVSLGRAFLQTPNVDLSQDIKDPLHVDSHQSHMVFLYYVVSSEGQTLLTDCKADWETDIPFRPSRFTYDKCNIIKRVTPKKGRLLMFDGRHYHAAEQSRKDMRCIINYNLLVNKND